MAFMAFFNPPGFADFVRVRGLPTAMSAQQLSYSAMPLTSMATPQHAIPEATSSNSSFRLHQDNEPASRLDPSLEINKNLMNWGMTYKAGGARTPRRTWDSERWQQEMSNAQFNQPNASPARRPPSAIYEFEQQQQQLQHQQLINAAQSTVSSSPSDYQTGHPQAGTSHDDAQHLQGSRSQIDNMIHKQQPAAVLKAKSVEPEVDASHRTSFSESSAPPAQISPSIANSVTSVKNANSGTEFVIGTDIERKTLEQEQKREQLLANAMRRRERMDAKKEEMEAKDAARKEALAKKAEAEAQKKLENELRRQRIREQYEQRKAEQAALQEGLEAGGVVGVSSTPRSPKKQAPNINRAGSQPPGRPKSTIMHSGSMKDARGRHGGSSATVNLDGMRNSESADKLNSLGRQNRVPVASTQEPAVKPFVKPRRNSNRNIIINALQYTVFAGTVHEQAKAKVMEDMAKADSKHFLLLFRDRKCQYRGMYTWDEESNQVTKICGVGPKVITEDMMLGMFKYDSGGKSFNEVPGMKHLSTTIDGFAIKDDYWKAAKKSTGAATPTARR